MLTRTPKMYILNKALGNVGNTLGIVIVIDAVVIIKQQLPNLFSLFRRKWEKF